MFERIMVTLDGSALAESVLPLAAALAEAFGSELILLRAVNPRPLFDSQDKLAAQSKVVSTAEKYLEKVQVRRRELWGLRIRTSVTYGPAAEAIVDTARTLDADLIVMATHGRSGLARWAIGSVTDQVLHTFPGCLLVIRPTIGETPVSDARGVRRLVIPLDGSEFAERVLDTGADLAQRLNAELQLVQVIGLREPITSADGRVVAYTDEQVAEDRVAADRYLASVADSLNRRGITASSQVLVGQVAEEIERSAAEHAGTLVVMSTHGRSGVDRWLHGSVTDEVVRSSDVPVLMRRALDSTRFFPESRRSGMGERLLVR